MIGRWWSRACGVAAGLVLVTVVAGCSPGAGLPEGPGEPTGTPTPTAALSLEPVPTLTVPATAEPLVDVTLPPIEPGQAPVRRYAVQRREITVTRDNRPLRTVLLFPSIRLEGGGQAVPPGTYPLILFSHGLRGTPELYEPNLRAIAAAGFVVAAPEYPHTSAEAAEYNPVDLVNQPADASAVITTVLALSATRSDPLAGHLDPGRVGAMGHSAGGYTTLGLLAGGRDARIRTAVVLAGGSMGGTYSGEPVPVLFVHGTADPIVAYARGRAAYDQVPWPKAFLTIIDGGHSDYLDDDAPSAPAVTGTVLDFLRATLYGDVDALARIPAEATIGTLTTFESALSPAR